MVFMRRKREIFGKCEERPLTDNVKAHFEKKNIKLHNSMQRTNWNELCEACMGVRSVQKLFYGAC